MTMLVGAVDTPSERSRDLGGGFVDQAYRGGAE